MAAHIAVVRLAGPVHEVPAVPESRISVPELLAHCAAEAGPSGHPCEEHQELTHQQHAVPRATVIDDAYDPQADVFVPRERGAKHAARQDDRVDEDLRVDWQACD